MLNQIFGKYKFCVNSPSAVKSHFPFFLLLENILILQQYTSVVYIYNIWVISWEIYSQNFFFYEIFFLPSYFENNWHVFFFQCDTLKFRDIIYLSLALGRIFFFQQLTVKAVLNIKCNPFTWNARQSTSFQKSYSTHFVVFFCNNNIVHFYKQLSFFLIWN